MKKLKKEKKKSNNRFSDKMIPFKKQMKTKKVHKGT